MITSVAQDCSGVGSGERGRVSGNEKTGSPTNFIIRCLVNTTNNPVVLLNRQPPNPPPSPSPTPTHPSPPSLHHPFPNRLSCFGRDGQERKGGISTAIAQTSQTTGLTQAWCRRFRGQINGSARSLQTMPLCLGESRDSCKAIRRNQVARLGSAKLNLLSSLSERRRPYS